MTSDLVPKLTKSEFEDFSKEGLVLIDFYAEWCSPCLGMLPIIEELSKKFKGKIKFCKINVEENQEIYKKFEVMSLPTFILLKSGGVIDQFMGSLTLESFENKLRKHL